MYKCISNGFFVSVVLGVIPINNAEAQSAADVAAKVQSAIDHGDLPSWWNPTLPEEIVRDVANKGKRLAGQLELNDESMTQKIADLISEHFGRVWAWHQQVDVDLNRAWLAWDAARDNTNGKQKDELRALTIWIEQIDPIYAEFKPQTHGLLQSLTREIGEDKTTLLMDLITRSPGAKRTYEAYLAMVPEMKDEERSILWNRMVRAREDSMASWSDKQIVKIFKAYKVRNEFSIDYFGYGYQKRYQEWVSKGAR
jgi:hypothetical protein